jgi:hypothetical protein
MNKISKNYIKIINSQVKKQFEKTEVLDIEYDKGVYLWSDDEDRRIFKTNVFIKTDSDLQDNDLMKIIFIVGDTGRFTCNEDIANLPLSVNIDFTYQD